MKEDPFGQYLQQIGRVPLLTEEEEISLGHAIQTMLRIKAEIEEGICSLPIAKQKRLIRAGERAKERMVTANLRLVVSAAKKWNRSQLNLEQLDLIQEGNAGLIRAAEMFDPTRGYKFSTYAYWWIRQGINRSISYHNRMIRLPGAALPAIFKAREFVLQYRKEHGKMPSVLQISQHCECTEESMKHYLNHINDCYSLDRKIHNASEEGESVLIDIIADPRSMEGEDIIFDREAAELCMDMVNRLDEKSRDVVVRYYGLDGKDPQTFAEIARSYKVSREAIRQAFSRATRRMRVEAAKTPLGKIYA